MGDRKIPKGIRSRFVKILITAGGTQEPIDSVRSIKNHATGRLGAMIAEAFHRAPEVSEIHYVCNRRAQHPSGEGLVFHDVGGTLELEETLRELIRTHRPRVIVHSMAVSDYRVRRVTTLSALALAALGAGGEDPRAVKAAMDQTEDLRQGGKLSSSLEDMTLLLEKTPKVIGQLRGLAPGSVLVGFKLLDGVSSEVLLETARQLMVENSCDFVLANDMKTVASPQHCGYLLDAGGGQAYFEGKEQIARGIVEAALRKAGV